VSRFRPTRVHVLLGLAVVLMATIPVLVPLAFIGGGTATPTEVTRLAAGPGVPAGPGTVPTTKAAPEAAPAAAGDLRPTTRRRTPTATPGTPTTPPAAPPPPPTATTTTTDATTTAPSSDPTTPDPTTPDPTTPDPTAEAKVFAAQSNLVVVGLSWDPGAPGNGQPVVFSATVRNTGAGPTPEVTHGVAFSVDGTEVTWSGADSTPLAPGEERTYTADNGLAGNAWTATTGEHTLQAWVDDINRIPERNEDDNTLAIQLAVS
jgi:hypothetical protein